MDTMACYAERSVGMMSSLVLPRRCQCADKLRRQTTLTMSTVYGDCLMSEWDFQHSEIPIAHLAKFAKRHAGSGQRRAS